MRSNLTVGGADFDLGNFELAMNLGTATYTAGTEEVKGKMTRNLFGAVTGTYYKYNNDSTRLNFASGTTLPTSFSIDSRGITAPVATAFDETTDLTRRFIPTWTGGTTDWLATIQAGYKATDKVNWAGTTSEAKLRYNEAEGAVIEKLATGEQYNRSITGTLRSISLAGVMPAATNAVIDGVSDKFIKSGNDLIMRGIDVPIIAIANGRWSNPDTWDEGYQPDSTDEVQINGFTVHAGYVRQTDNFAGVEVHPENLAKKITIGGIGAQATADGSGLLFGSTVAGINSFSMNPNGLILNRDGGAAADVPLNENDLANTQIEGPII